MKISITNFYNEGIFLNEFLNLMLAADAEVAVTK